MMERYRSKPDIVRVLQRRIKEQEEQLRILGNRDGSTDWIEITAFTNGWVNFGGASDTAAYKITSGGEVELKGTIKDGTIGQSAFTLPVGYRPKLNRYWAVPSNGAFGYIYITPAGLVVPNGASSAWIALDAVKFTPQEP